ncbi:hypothetical protein [Phaeacidiphilus oryzae]|uniref:hypothetical protein n=1 Tax=Phaeacidiphilus oryzae TaxID=348818 RepID=UPI00055DAFD4|nr:hypothetical protein [Phaeacidiphilus oryzae]
MTTTPPPARLPGTDALRATRTLAATQGGVLLRRQAWECGLGDARIRALVGRGQWRPLEYGVLLVDAERYADTGPPLLAALWAAHLRCGPRSTIALGSAARAHGLGGPARGLPWVDVVVPRGQRPRPGRRLLVHQADLRPGEIVHLGRLPLTSPVRTLTDLLLRLHAPEALALLDSALHHHLVGPPELGAVARALAFRRSEPATRALRLLPHADGRSAGPLESRIRWDCVLGGVPPDSLDHPVRQPGGERILARVPFRWGPAIPGRPPLLGLVDGPGAPRTLPPAAGRVLRFHWNDALTPGRCAARVREALAKSPAGTG